MRIKILLVLVVIASCTHTVKKPSTPVITPAETVPTDKFGMEFTEFTKTEPEMQEKLKVAALKMSETMASQCFKDYWMKRKLVQTNNKTNEEVYNHLEDSAVKVAAEMYYTSSNVYGHTYPSQMKLWFNTKYYNKWNSCQMAANIGHERSHKLGYEHDYKSTKQRPYSVPYSIGTGIKECCK